MRRVFLLTLLTLNLSGLASANNWETQNEKWGEMDVTLIPNESFPTYSLYLYFADGAKSDHPKRLGETELMFNLMDKGTHRYNQSEISDHLEFYGAGHGGSVTHEFSLYSVSGLAKDIVPTLKKVCHLFSHATFPRRELEKYRKRYSNVLRNLVTSHAGLADRAIRIESLKGSPIGDPTGGYLNTLKGITSDHLKSKLERFRTEVKKRLYFTGPPHAITSVRKILLSECGFEFKKEQFERRISLDKYTPQKTPKIVLVSVPKANQAQIRIGKFLTKGGLDDFELMNLTSNLLGGGFTSLLNTEIRVKRGLSYGVGAVAGRQKEYGRSIIMTSTKTKSVVEAIRVIKDTLHHTVNGLFTDDEFTRVKKYVSGSYLFRFESREALLSNMINFDHVGVDYKRMFSFPEVIKGFSKKELSQKAGELFDWDSMVILVVGPKSLKKKLSKLGDVKVVSYREYL